MEIAVDSSCVSVTDTGPGIGEDMRQKLFEPFVTSGKRGGTGLGLSYCKRAMHAFGGGIRCESEVGEFTRFILDFPELETDEVDIQQHQAEAQARDVLAGKHILVVDDEDLVRLHTLRMLHGLDLVVEQASSAAAAIEHLRNRTCDLIVMDINLPGEDGCATTERIRAGVVPGKEFVPILAYSSEPEDVLRVMSNRSGMNAYLAKPCGRGDLVAALVSCFDHATRHATYQAMAVGLAGKCVLLAEDNPFNRLIVSSYLERWRVKVLAASHGAEVLAHLQRGAAVDAILMDLHMPGMDGIETTVKLRHADAAWRQVPVIALTGESTEDAVGRAYAAGMNDFVTKPIDPMNLCAILHRQIGGNTGRTTSPAPALTLEREGTWSILDRERLDELAQIGMLDSLPLYQEKTAEALLRLRQAMMTAEFGEMHQAMHSLLGMSGDVGAQALHRLVKRYYPLIAAGVLLLEADWFDRIEKTHAATVLALQEAFPGNGNSGRALH